MFFVQTGEFIQILHENNYWVTVSSPAESATSVVYLYSSSQKENLNKNLVKQIARLRWFVGLKVIQLKQQKT